MNYLIIISLFLLFAACERPTIDSRDNHNVALDTVYTFTIHIGTFDFASGYTLSYTNDPDSLTIAYRDEFGQEDTIIHRQSPATNYRDSIRYLLSVMALDTFQQRYQEIAVADGQIISLAIRVNESPEKRIGISNYYLADMFPLFDLIDSILPSNYRIGYHDSAQLLRKLMRGELEGETMWTYWNGKEEVGEWEYCVGNRCYSLDLREDSTAVLFEPEGRSWPLTFTRTRQTIDNDSLDLGLEAFIIQTRQTVDTVDIYKLTLDSMVTVGFPHISTNGTVRFCRVRQ